MKSKSQKSIAVWQPYFRGGGAEAVALWILEALHNDYAVTLHTLSPVDFNWLNAMYGTHLSSEKIDIKTYIPSVLDKPAYYLMSVNEIFRMAMIYLTIKGFKQQSDNYDVVFSAFNALDMGRPGIQYLHWINVVEKPYKKAPRWYKSLMYWVGFSHHRLKQNTSIANSQFTASQVKKVYGIDSKIIFPPVITDIDSKPWHEKENAFLCSGRLVRAKSPHRVIHILQKVRERGFDIKLHITGGGGGVYEQKYQRELRSLIRQNSDWIYLHQNLPYDDYLKIVACCRYGLHVKPEPFGISVAEMLKADIIPFVRFKGGQVEIVGAENSELLFDNDEEAVQKIVNVLGNDALRKALSEVLAQRKSLFTTQNFIEHIKSATENFISHSQSSKLVARH